MSGGRARNHGDGDHFGLFSSDSRCFVLLQRTRSCNLSPRAWRGCARAGVYPLCVLKCVCGH